MPECPCGSQTPYRQCCEPLLKGDRKAATAEELMRSRYTAYTVADIDFIAQTTHPEQRESLDTKSAQAWAERSEWHQLDIVATEGGGADDSRGSVEFIAHYTEKGTRKQHHELAEFEKEGDTWFFVDGSGVPPSQYVRETPKIGRNSPCPCGSGKKYKKCCGA